MNTPLPPTPARLRINSAAMFVILLIGLPTLLYILLWATRTHLGHWPAIALTLVIGIALSVIHKRQPGSPLPDAELIRTHGANA